MERANNQKYVKELMSVHGGAQANADTQLHEATGTDGTIEVLSDDSQDSIAVVKYLLSRHVPIRVSHTHGETEDRPALIHQGTRGVERFIGKVAIAEFMTRLNAKS